MPSPNVFIEHLSCQHTASLDVCEWELHGLVEHGLGGAADSCGLLLGFVHLYHNERVTGASPVSVPQTPCRLHVHGQLSSQVLLLLGLGIFIIRFISKARLSSRAIAQVQASSERILTSCSLGLFPWRVESHAHQELPLLLLAIGVCVHRVPHRVSFLFWAHGDVLQGHTDGAKRGVLLAIFIKYFQRDHFCWRYLVHCHTQSLVPHWGSCAFLDTRAGSGPSLACSLLTSGAALCAIRRSGFALSCTRASCSSGLARILWY